MSDVKLVYIAGPFSGRGETEAEKRADVERNIAEAVKVGLTVAALGGMPVIPHANTSHPRFESVQPYEFWIDGTMALLERCDAVVTVDGWERSSGASAEVNRAIELGLPVFHGALLDRAALIRWLHPEDDE